MRSDIERALAFGSNLQEWTSTRVEPFRWGRAFFNDDIPQRYYSNLVRVERSLAGVEVDILVDDTDRALAGCRHRLLVVPDDGDGARIAPSLADHGYSAEHSATLAWRRAPDRPGNLDAVEEIGFIESRPFEVEVYRRQLVGETQEVVERFADFRQIVQRSVTGRFFAQRVDGQVAGLCELYLSEGLAQVEHVDTLEEYRGRGIARNVVLRAVQEATKAGADLVIIDADLDDWPIELYGRLGFDEIGRSWAFLKAPTGP